MATAGSVQSVSRVLDIMELLSSAPSGMTLSELAAETQLHISTAHRLVNVLVERGYAVKDRKTYRLTLRAFEIGSRVSSIWSLLAEAKPKLEELAAFSKETVHLVERDGNSVVYLYKAEPYQQLVRMGSHAGLRNPMYCTGVGKCILAYLPWEEVKQIWQEETIVAFSPNTITDLDRMKQELAKIRQQGYAVDNEEHEPNVRCLAVAIRNWAGAPVAAVSISAPIIRLDAEIMETMLPKLRATADAISAMLGWRKE